MSHFSKINAKISDEEALSAATTKMGLSLIPDGMCRYYYGTEKADMVVKLPGEYDVALTKEGDSYSLKADLYKGQVEKYVGPNAGLLMQRYSAEKARIEAFKKSLAITEVNDGDDIVLTLTDSETGGQIKVVCHIGGEIDVKTSGFPGQSCMKFQDLESALGANLEFTPTMEMYEAEKSMESEHINNMYY